MEALLLTVAGFFVFGLFIWRIYMRSRKIKAILSPKPRKAPATPYDKAETERREKVNSAFGMWAGF